VRRSAHSVAIGFAALRANPLRTMLSTLGVVIGVAALVAILALGDGLERYSRLQLAETTDLEMLSVEPVTVDRTADGVLVRRRDVPSLSAADASRLAGAAGGRAAVTLALAGSGWLALDGDTTRHATLVTATLPHAERVLPLVLEAGRLLEPGDTAAGTAAVVSASAAHALAPGAAPESLLGRAILVDRTPYAVVGVLAGETTGAARVYVALDAAARQRWGSAGREAPSALLRARRVEDVEPVRLAVERWLERRFGPGRFTVTTRRGRVAQAQRGILVFKLVMGSITGIAVLVGGIGIMNVLLASVAERTREIGVRKAVGARRRDILVQFLAESVAIAGVGSVLGVGVGLGGAYAITGAIRGLTAAQLHAAFTWSTPAVAAVLALAVGITFGTYPARRAARLAPIEAIRHD
jgi:putative ABC transport system permease protein